MQTPLFPRKILNLFTGSRVWFDVCQFPLYALALRLGLIAATLSTIELALSTQLAELHQIPMLWAPAIKISYGSKMSSRCVSEAVQSTKLPPILREKSRYQGVDAPIC
jgi:hypothetical protein